MTRTSSLTCKVLAGILALLGLNSCNSKRNLALDNAPGKRKEQKELPRLDPREDVGRAIALYGGPNMRFKQIEKEEPPAMPEE